MFILYNILKQKRSLTFIILKFLQNIIHKQGGPFDRKLLNLK